MNDRTTPSAVRRRFPADAKGFLFAPVLWFVWFVVIYAVQGAGCAAGMDHMGILGTSALRVVLAVLTIAAGAAIAIVGLKSYMAWKGLRDEADDAGGRALDQANFLAYGALLHAALFLVAVIWTGLPIMMSDLCNPS